MIVNAANPQPVDVPAPTEPRGIDALVDAAVAQIDAEAAGGEKPADEAQADAEPTEATKQTEGKPPEKPADEPEPKRGSLAWRQASVRKREKELEARSEELAALKAEGDRLMQAIRQREEQARTVAELVELARQDPERAFAMLAERAGMSEHALYDRVTRRRLRDPAQAEAANPELAILRAEIRAMREEQRQREEQSQAEHHRSTMAQSMEADVAKVIALADYPDRWPYASEWPAERLKAEATALIRAAYEKNAPIPAKDIADRLERKAVYEEETRTKVRSARSKSPALPATSGDGRGLPGAAGEAPKPAGQRRAVGNADNASTAARKAPTSFDERFALAVEEALAAQSAK